MNNIDSKEKEIVCICCPIGCDLRISKNDSDYNVTGNKCPRGRKYAIDEITAPKRIVTSTVAIKGCDSQVITVKTASPIPKEKIFEIMDILSDVTVNAPVKVGDIIVHDVAGTGIDIVATKNAPISK